MTFLEIYAQSLAAVFVMVTLVWLLSLPLKNASIVDIFWGAGFVVLAWFYFFLTDSYSQRNWVVAILTTIWGMRLSLYLLWRNCGKGEDFRYRKWRSEYGETRYWWISFFQVYLLQGVLMALIAAPLLGAQYRPSPLNFLDYLGIIIWSVGLFFETCSDLQLAKFKAAAANKGKLLTTGLWRYTRHPNYFGDACVWWGYGLICLAGGSYIPVYGSVLMTLLIIYVSGVAMLEKTLTVSKPGYEDYIKNTSAFFPWFPQR